MASSVPSFLVFIFVALGGCAILGMGGLPAWLMAPIMQLRNAARPQPQFRENFDAPEAVLLERLKSIDANREPEAAFAIHATIGKMLRSSGAPLNRVVEHLTLARDLALRGKDSDAKLAAHLDLAEALIENGRPSDAQHELTRAHEVYPDHFVESRVRLIRLQGKAKFQLGQTDSGLNYLQRAEQHAVQQDEKVNVALDTGIVRTCLGDITASLKALHQALDILKAARKVGPEGGMSGATHDALALQVYFRLAEAYHFKRDFIAAKAHYDKALSFDRKSTSKAPKQIAAMKVDLLNLEHGIGPDLQCPVIPKAPWDKTQTEVEKVEAQDANAKVSLLLSQKEYDKAEAMLLKNVKRHPRPYKAVDAVNDLNRLGKLCSMEERKKFQQAAKYFRQALLGALSCCGANSDPAKAAYEGLKQVRDFLSSHERAVATAAINRYDDAAKIDRLSPAVD
jgi:tetratricopeptide (TPR) repeat protein